MLHFCNFLLRPLTMSIFWLTPLPLPWEGDIISGHILIWSIIYMVHLNGVSRFPIWWIFGVAIFNLTMWKSSCHKLCTWMVSLLHGSSNGTSSFLILKIPCHTLCNWMASLDCNSLHESSPDVEKLLSHLVHSIVVSFKDPLMVLQVSW